MSLKPKGSFKIRIRKLKNEECNENCLNSEYEGHIKIRNPQQSYLKIRNQSKKGLKYEVRKTNNRPPGMALSGTDFLVNHKI